MRDDQVFYIISLSGFVQSLSQVLFALNRSFFPGGRLLQERVGELPVLPDSFHGRFQSLLRYESDLDPEQKREIAELLARSVIVL